MQSVCIQIDTKARPLTSMMVQGLVFGAVMRKTQTEISTSIKDFVMLDLNPATLHKKVVFPIFYAFCIHMPLNLLNILKNVFCFKILSIVDEEALSAHVVMYDTTKAEDVDAIDMTVKVQMACLHVVFLNWFVSSLLVSMLTTDVFNKTKLLSFSCNLFILNLSPSNNFFSQAFLNNFQAAQAAVYEASAAAAAVAKQNAKEAYTKATRMSLDIELKVIRTDPAVPESTFSCDF